MPMSAYVRGIRRKIGCDLLMLQAVAVMVFDEQRRLLVAQEAGSGLWMTIGGGIEPNETPADAAVRECWEETGLLIEPLRLVGVFGGAAFRTIYANGDVVSYVVTAFEARRVGGEPVPDGVETSALRFVSCDEAADLPMGVLNRELVAGAFAYEGVPYFAKARWRPGGG